METLSQTLAADVTREKGSCSSKKPVSRVVSDSLSLPSYKDYPAHRPFIGTLVHRAPPQPSLRSPSPSKAFPETNSAAILSALRNLQEKIRRLELEKGEAELRPRARGGQASHRVPQGEVVPRRHLSDQTGAKPETHSQPNCNQVLITHLAAAESRCVTLERQLDHMRKMLHGARTERTSLLHQQVCAAEAKSAHRQSDSVSERAQLEKLERLEQEYRRLTRTQNDTEVKICELEEKLREEARQRQLVQAKAQQLQSGLETNRILLQSVSPQLTLRQSREKKSRPKRSSSQQPSCPKPHYRLSLRDVPFVTGTSVGCSHSVRANVQSVLSLLKRHQPQLCNSRVLSDDSSSSSSSSSGSEEELSELLQALQEELRLMSLEQDELMRQIEGSASVQDRRDLQREQERLLLKMERKGEQIGTLNKHRAQIKKLRREARSRTHGGKEARASSGVSTRGHPAGAVKARPGERSRRNLRLLRDMRTLQTSLQT